MKLWGGPQLLALGLIFTLGMAAYGFQKPQHNRLPNLDKRVAPGEAKPVAPEKQAAVEKLRGHLARVQVDFDPLLGTPKMVRANDGFLTGPNGQGRGGISAKSLAGIPANDPHRALKGFLKEHQELFGHGPEALDKAAVKRDFVTPHNGMHTVVWEQELDGIPLFEAILQAHTTKAGELIQVSSHFVPDPQGAADRGTASKRQAKVSNPLVSARRAIALAAANVGEKAEENDVAVAEPPLGRPDKFQKAKAAVLKGPAEAKLIWLPMDKDLLRLCWDVLFTSQSRGEMFRVLVDAESGDILVRHCLTEYISDASYRVFTSDSPSPSSPGNPTPLTNQPPLVERTLVTLSALNTNASPNGWIDDGVNETRGNNVDAHLDRNADNSPDLPRPQGSPIRVFDFPMDLSTQDPTNYSSAAVVNLFYWCNFMHDRLYELGFTEAAGNFQGTNFGRGGLGNDAVQADAQDGEGTDNANMSTPSDGSPPRLQMFIFTGPHPRRDGDLDAEVVLHEYTHGLSNRRVGGGVGISALQSEGMGEGWSDFYAQALLGQPGDDINGVYASGAYVSYLLVSGFTQNYYFGIRRYPYCTDMLKNPLTFKDIDAAQASPHSGVPLSPWFMPWSAYDADEVHDQGELWCMTLLEVRANLIAKYGYTNGNPIALRLVTDGMTLSPVNPTFLQARDAIIQADRVNNGTANYREIWMAFAKRGMGYWATSPASSTTAGVRESFDLPDDLLISPVSDYISRGPVGGPFSLTSASYVLTNIGSNAFTWSLVNTSAWLNASLTGGSLAARGSATVNVTLDSSATMLAAGVHRAALVFSNQSSGIFQIRYFRLNIGLPDYFTEVFDTDANDLAYQSFTFTPNGSSSFYAVCHEAITNFPADPTGGTAVSLVDDSYVQVTLPTNSVALYSRRTNVFFIGSNGYLTFGNGDQEYIPTFYDHFLYPRVAALFDDLNPSTMGTISWKQLTNRVAVTWSGVPKYGSSLPNYFQIEMFYDGRIRVSFLQLSAQHSLVGLSAGLGVPGDFDESDWSTYSQCGPTLALTVPATATEGDGVLAGQGILSLTMPLPTNLVVNLASSNTNEVTVPATPLFFVAGRTNLPFDVTIVDDAVLDGTQTAVISASAPGLNIAQAAISVFDNESAQLRVTAPASVREGDGMFQAILSVPAPPAVNVPVALGSSDSSELQVPLGVILPAGQTSVVFNVTVVDDPEIDGIRTATLIAHVQNWVDGQCLISVLDNENLNLNVSLPVFATEGDGILTNAGVVSISGTITSNLVVNLASSDTTELVVPATATIPAGQTSARFNLTVIDDLLVDSNQTVTVIAQAPGFVDGSATMIIADNESPPMPANPSPPHLATNIAAEITLSWSTGTNTTNEVYFGTNPAPGPAEYQGLAVSNNWTPPRLAPLTKYYWQIVSHRIGVTASPVWQFTTRGVDHYQWAAVGSPQAVNRPFSVTVSAKDYLDRVVTNFPGPVSLTGQIVGAASTLEDFESGPWPHTPWTLDGGGALSLTNAHDGAYGLSDPDWTYRTDVQIGNPGDSISWWVRFSDSGRAYLGFAASSNGCWSIVAAQNTGEFILQQNPGYDYNELVNLPQSFVLGRWYKVAVQFRSGAAVFCQLYDSDGVTVLNSLSYTNITGLPGGVAMRSFSASLDTIRQEGTLGPIAISPTNSGAFANGSWTGDVVVQQPGENIFLTASDNLGKAGSCNNFAVQVLNDISVYQSSSPDPVDIGAVLTYNLLVANSGPTAATQVAFTNWLPPGLSFVSCNASQGSCANNSGILTCILGTIPGGSNVTVLVAGIPNAAGTLTNRAGIGRAESDSYPLNNSSILLTTVTPPSVNISDTSVVEGDGGNALAIFEVRLSTASSNSVSVAYATSNGTATAGIDFIPTNGVLAFSPGQTTNRIAVSVIGDILIEPDEVFYVNLSRPTNALLGRATGIGTILNDDGLPGKIDHFAWDVIPSPQEVGAPFAVKVAAQDAYNQTVSNYAGPVAFSIPAQSTGTIFPANSGPFVNGVWSGTLACSNAGTNLVLLAQDALGYSGRSNPFQVAPDAQSPIILVQPRSQTVAIGVTAVISVSVFGTPPLAYQWFFNGTNLLAIGDASLVLSNVDASASGNYSVLITNAFGAAWSATVFLNVVPEGQFFDDFEPGIHAAQWSGFGGTVLATNYGSSVSGVNSLWFGGDGSRYAVSRPVNTLMGGTIDFYLRLADGGSAPWEQVDLPEEGVVLECSSNDGATWVEIGRYDDYSYTVWTHIQTDIPAEAQSTNALFRWRQLSNSGSCCDQWALDDVGVFVGPRPPSILSQPANRTVLAGGSAQFSALVGGTPPLGFQWLKQGLPIPGATNSAYLIVNAQANDAGGYSLVVTNIYGAVTSSVATLAVIQARVAEFQIVSLLTNHSLVVEHEAITGDDRGGMAASGDRVFYTGDSSTARFALADLSGPAALGRVYDALVGDLRSGKVYSLANGTNLLTSAGGTATTLREHDNLTGALTGSAITLSAPIPLGINGGNVGIFAGYGQIVLHNGTNVFQVLLPEGYVLDLGVMPAPAHSYSENWAYWGVAEYFGGSLYIDCVRDYTAITRTAVPSGVTTILASFSNLSDMACFTVSLPCNRWYFHYEGSGQFGGTYETLGFAEAVFNIGPSNPPVIMSQPASRSIPMGATATFNVLANGSLPLFYAWMKNGAFLTSATNASLTVTNVQLADAGVYSVLASNAFGITFSSNANLNVNTSVLARVGILGAPGTDSWNEDVRSKIFGIGLFNEVDAQLVKAGYPVPTLADLQQYSAVLVYSDSFFNDATGLGNVLADYVDSGGGVVMATFAFSGSVSPSGRIVTGGYLPFNIGAGNATGVTNMVMDLPSHPILNGVASLNGGTSGFHDAVTLASGATQLAHWDNSVPLIGTKQISAGRVVGLNFYPPSSDARSDFWLASTDGGRIMANALVWSAGSQIPSAPVIVRQPANLTVYPGSNIIFQVIATGSFPLYYQWFRNSSSLPGATDYAYAISGAQTNDSGTYSVVVSNAYGSVASSNAVLTVIAVYTLADALNTPGRIWTTSGNASWSPQTSVTHDGVLAARSGVISNNQYSAIQTVFADSPGTVSFWWKVSSEAGGDSLTFYTNSVAVTSISGEADWQYFAWQVPTGSVALQWRYTKNAAVSSGQDCAWLDQVSINPIVYAPTITLQPQDQNAAVGAAVTFTASATGTAPLGYLWFFNGNVPLSWATASSLVLSNVQPSLAGTYSVQVSNAWGTVNSRSAVLQVQYPPTIVEQPQSQTVAAGTDVALSVTTTGGLPMSYRWKKGGLSLTNIILNQNTCSYTLTNVQLATAGTYSATITNLVGFAITRSAYVIVVQPPTNQVVPLGSTVEFSARVNSGSSSNILGYQWRFNGMDLPGETSTNLYLTNVACGRAGIYTFVVTNQLLMPTGFDARLTVLDAIPPALTCPSNLVLVADTTNGAVAVFTVLAADNCDSNLLAVCVPPSGSIFPPGTNVVVCSATDSGGNSNQCQFTVYVEDRAHLTLSIAREGTNLVVSWPKAGGPRQLQRNTHVDPAEWNPVPDPPEDSGGTFFIRLPVTNENKFFRLRQTP